MQWIKNYPGKFSDYTISLSVITRKNYVTLTEDNNKCNIATYDIFLEDWFNALKTKVNCRLRADYKKHKASDTGRMKKNWILTLLK
ncbi:hypothetical protein RhiirA5_447185 [Rhizophagus irregularis]|uniref:Uncharacterized protein n=1 Tax=Rhizophagus irregularis TaxID=588596 RepID=A0A2N0NBB2_9GLOM|nr:hypothetical protein RhiirA5_447185 [Rhizophagus irregularis]GET55946.1 hypothetical protein RIR_jg26530.t1 [Rhizophagus irregularis DAOM 181602=DAOM 197198]